MTTTPVTPPAVPPTQTAPSNPNSAPTPSAALSSFETDAKSLLASHMTDLKSILTSFVDEVAGRAGADAATWVPKTKAALDAWIAKL